MKNTNTRVFRIKASITESPTVVVEGISKTKRPCRIWTTILNRRDGSYIVRYKLYETCVNLKISVTYQNQHLSESPYIFDSSVYPDDCICPLNNITEIFNTWECGIVPNRIKNQIERFGDIDWPHLRKKV